MRPRRCCPVRATVAGPQIGHRALLGRGEPAQADPGHRTLGQPPVRFHAQRTQLGPVEPPSRLRRRLGASGIDGVRGTQSPAVPDETGSGHGIVAVIAGEELVDGDAVEFGVRAPLGIGREH